MENQFLIIIFVLCTSRCIGQNNTTIPYVKRQKSVEYQYLFSNDTLTQKAKIVFKTKNQIIFSITSINKIRNTICTFSDTAIVRNTYGADNVQAYEDELESDMYPAKEYIFNKQCHITIGIDARDNSRLFIVESQNCKTLNKQYCHIGSLGTLRLKK